MTAPFRHGLVVGKFSPLHRGHEFLIESARAACDRVTVLSYSKPEFPRCDAMSRRAWLANRAPEVRAVVFDEQDLSSLCRIRGIEGRAMPCNDAPDDVQRAFVAWVCLQLLSARVDAVFTSEDYGDGLASFLSRAFSHEAPLHGSVVHRMVDQQRRAWPVRGTDVREEPVRWRDKVDPFVYADLIPRVCILGGESSGKTTLAGALAQAIDASLVPEYGRTHWEQTQQDLGMRDLEIVARTQVAREVEAAQSTPSYLVCDTSPLTTLVYALLDHGRPSRHLVALSRRRYDLTVLCRPDIPFQQDGTRRTEAWRASQHALTLELLRRRHLPFVEVSGTLEERVAQVLGRLH